MIAVTALKIERSIFMPKKFTRLLSLLLVLVLAVGLVPLTASAATNIIGTWETDFVFSAADLGVQANDAVFRCRLTFDSDGTINANWTAIDLSAIRLYFHQIFVSAYYACAYASGVTDIQMVEYACMEATGMSVSDYIASFLDSYDMNALFTPAPESGTYAVVDNNLYLTMTLMGNSSNGNTPNPITRQGGALSIQAASFGRSDYVLNCWAIDVSPEDTVPENYGSLVDLTDKLNTLMRVNATALENFLAEQGYVKACLFYHAMVTDGGDWDIKLTDEWKFEPGKTYIYQGKVMRMDDPGNIHFGYTGAILFPEEFVCFGAGMNNLSKFGFTAGDLDSYFDDPQDQEMMRWGYQMYKNKTLQ